MHADQLISQISPKSENIPNFDEAAPGHQQPSSSVEADRIALKTTAVRYNDTQTINDASNGLDSLNVANESENAAKSRVLRSALPVLHDDEQASKINLLELEPPIELDALANKPSNGASGRYFNLIQPTSTLSKHHIDAAAQSMTGDAAHARSYRSSSFLSKRGPRLIPSTSPSRPPVSTTSHANATTSIKPTLVTPTNSIEMQTAVGPNHGRQNPNPDIQDIITGIVKLLNGNVNVHANTQPQPSRRPHTRINNRGPPRISDVQPLPPNIDENIEYEQSQPTPASTMRPPMAPYPFDRPEGPIRPFLSGVPLPEQIVPASNNNNYRPGFISQQQQSPQQQNRPPWQRPRPRPPIISNPNRRPILTPPPYKFTSRPVQELRPPDIDPIPTSSQISPAEHDEKAPPNTNSSFENTDLLANEQLPAATNESASTASPTPSKEEFSKKKDKLKKPITMPVVISPTKSAEVSAVTTTPTMKTIIHTSSEVHSSQLIASSTPSIEPSEQLFSKKSQSIVTSSASTQKTPELFQPTTQSTSSSNINVPLASANTRKTSHDIATPTQSTPNVALPSNFPTFHPRPGIVLDDPEFKPGGHARPSATATKPFNIQPTRVHPSNLPPGYGEIFDVTLSAIQGPGNGGANSGLQTINIKPFGAANNGNDIIITAAGDESFVSIDGKRTYINLFGESTEPPNQLPLATKVTAAVTAAKTASIQPTKTVRTF